MNTIMNKMTLQLLTACILTVFGVGAAYAGPFTYTFSLGGNSTVITPLTGAETAEEYYDYWSYSGHPDFGVEESTAFLWLWEDTAGNISLNAIFSSEDNNKKGAGKASFTLSGLPFGSGWDFKDDSEWSIATEPNWKWNSENTDGGIIGGLAGAEWDINWFANKVKNLNNWYFLSGDADKYANGFSVAKGDDFTVSSTAPVPEPATLFLFGTGLVGFAAGARRKKK